MDREQKIKAVEKLVEKKRKEYEDLFPSLNPKIPTINNFLSTAIVDSMEIKFNNEKLEYIANYFSEFITDGKCCLPDLTPYSRQLMIARANKFVEIFTSDIIKIKE